MPQSSCPSPRALVVVQYAHGWVVEVVELTIVDRRDEEAHEDRAQKERSGEEKGYSSHIPAFLRRGSTRSAVTTTMALESGIKIAAASGLMSPPAAAPTATIL